MNILYLHGYVWGIKKKDLKLAYNRINHIIIGLNIELIIWDGDLYSEL